MKTQWLVIGRGKVGWHARGFDDDKNAVSSNGGSLEEYLKEAVVGCMVYDALNADHDAFIKYVYCAPILDLALKPNEVRHFQDHKVLTAILPALGGAFETIGQIGLNNIGSIDSVGIDVMRALLAKIPGIRLGIVISGRVVWQE